MQMGRKKIRQSVARSGTLQTETSRQRVLTTHTGQLGNIQDRTVHLVHNATKMPRKTTMKRILIALALLGCAKTPTETITEAALQKTEEIHQKIKNECPTAKFDNEIADLQKTIKTQLAMCESEQGKLKERNNTLIVIIIGIIIVLITKQRWIK